MQSGYIAGSVMDSPVGLLLVEAAGRSNAMTVSFFSEVAHHPTTLWVSIARTAYTYSLIRETGQFSLAVLSASQKQIARSCGSVSGRTHNKCAALDLCRRPAGFLFLQGALASTACRVRESFQVGDHTLFVADILEGETSSRASYLRHLLLSDL